MSSTTRVVLSSSTKARLVVSCSNRHASPDKWVCTASPQLLRESAVVRSRTAAQHDILSHAIEANPLYTPIL